jgi:uncharacterized phage-like protein YoqJ
VNGNWVASLGELPVSIALLVVFTLCVILILRAVFKHTKDEIITPFKDAIDNHFEHDREDRKTMVKVIEDQTESNKEHAREFKNLAERVMAFIDRSNWP